jgi:haloalkane dehalogenase
MDRRTFIMAASTLAIAGGSRIANAKARAILLRKETDVEAFTAERRFAELPQGRIAYAHRGKGPAALFLHGFPLNGYQWRGALDRLSDSRRCIVPDVLGLGYTEPRQGQDLRAPAQAEMALALLDRLGVGKFDMIANDSGCAIAH